MTLNAALAGVIEIILVDLVPLFLTVATAWILWYAYKRCFPTRSEARNFF
jgi:hypothetical protein